MLLNLIAALAGAVGVVALLFAGSHLFRRKLPKWLYPVGAALGMLAMTIYLEYAWYGETRRQLPDEVAIIETFTYTSPLQPWTLLYPRVSSLAAVNLHTIRRNPKVDGLVLADVYVMERLAPTLAVTQFVDCVNHRRAIAGDKLEMTPDGAPVNADWQDLDPDSALLKAVCTAGG